MEDDWNKSVLLFFYLNIHVLLQQTFYFTFIEKNE